MPIGPTRTEVAYFFFFSARDERDNPCEQTEHHTKPAEWAPGNVEPVGCFARVGDDFSDKREDARDDHREHTQESPSRPVPQRR